MQEEINYKRFNSMLNNHKMKRIILFALIMGSGIAASAQSVNDEIDYMQAIFGMEKRAAVMNFVNFEEGEESTFWKLYDEYEIIRKEYGKQRFLLLNNFVENFDKMSDEESEVWMRSVIDLRKRNEKLIESYYKKIRKNCSASLAMQFYQISGGQPTVLVSFLDLLFRIAAADGRFHPAEESVLQCSRRLAKGSAEDAQSR